MLRSSLKKLSASEGIKQSLFFSVGNLGSFGISAVALLLVSRKLEPALFSEFWIGYAFLTILAKVQSLGLPTALQKLAGKVYANNRSVHQLFEQSIVLLCCSVGVGAVLGIFVASQLSSVLGITEPSILYIAVACASITAFFEHFATYHQVKHNFFIAIAMLALQSIAKLVIAGLFIFTGTISIPVLFGLFYSMPILSVVLGYFLLSDRNIFPEKIEQPVLQKFFQIVPHTIFMAIGLAVMDYVDVFFIRKFGTATETGLYGGVSQFALAVTLVAQAVGNVLNARVSRYDQWSDLSSYLKKVPLLLLGGVVGYLFFLPLAEPIVHIALGESYASGGTILVGLVTAAVIFAGTLPLTAILYIDQDRSDYFSISTVLMMIIQVGGGLLIIPSYGIAGAVAIRILSRVVVFLYTLFAVISFLRRKYSTVRSNPS